MAGNAIMRRVARCLGRRARVCASNPTIAQSIPHSNSRVCRYIRAALRRELKRFPRQLAPLPISSCRRCFARSWSRCCATRRRSGDSACGFPGADR